MKIRTHYDNLKVARDAPDIVIRAAYRSLSQRYHPDKNPNDEGAARAMALINRSYEVLSDPQKKREHDAWIAREEVRLQQQGDGAAKQASPQGRTYSAAPSSPKPSVLIRLLLWPVTLLVKILVAVPQLAVLGLIIGGVVIYDAITPDRPPAPGPLPYQPEPSSLPQASTEAISDCKVIRSGVYSYVQGGMRHYSSRKPAECDSTLGVGEAAAAEVNAKLAVAPNGSHWPSAAGYVDGYPIDNDNGYSNVTVDNGRNDSDVFVKLVDLNDAVAHPVRSFYVPGGSKFTMRKVAGGKYDIRYRDLSSGGLSRSEPFEVTEIHTADGVRYSEISMTLYKVQSGNFQTYALSETEF